MPVSFLDKSTINHWRKKWSWTITAVVSLDDVPWPNAATTNVPSLESNHNHNHNNPILEEKRLHHYQSLCPTATKDHIVRFLMQCLFLVQYDSANSTTMWEGSFVVLSLTRNVYTVKVSYISRCTCLYHASGHLCKHILFMLLKWCDCHLIYLWFIRP